MQDGILLRRLDMAHEMPQALAMAQAAHGNGPFASSTLTTTNIIASLARADGRHSRQLLFFADCNFELQLLVQHSDI